MPTKTLRLCTAALLALGLAGCQQAYFRALNLGIAEGSSVAYDAANGLSLDVYRPAATSRPAPVVVFFYGGSWRNGDRGGYRFVGRALAREGVVVVIPDYRKAPAHPFPAFMHDAAAATAWVHAHAAELGGDPSRVFLMGHSAGAQIAALLATDARYLDARGLRPVQLAGVIGLAGPYDFLPLTSDAIRQALGPASGWPDTQPVNFVDGDEPPFLLLQGAADRTVDPGNAERLAARLRASTVPVQVTMVPGVGHVGLVNGFRAARFSPALADSLRWIRAGGAASPGIHATASRAANAR
jgi:acetyl esterase/lipase